MLANCSPLFVHTIFVINYSHGPPRHLPRFMASISKFKSFRIARNARSPIYILMSVDFRPLLGAEEVLLASWLNGLR